MKWNEGIDRIKIPGWAAAVIIVLALIGLVAAISYSVDEGVDRLDNRNRIGGIKNNLRIIASSADQYFLIHPEIESVDYSALVSEGLLSFELRSIAGENYEGIILQRGFEGLSVKDANGEIYVYRMRK